MKYIIFLFVITSISCTDMGVYDKNEVKKNLIEIAEKAYFEGQKDALEGDIRIKLISDSIYVWTKSPWDNGDKPIFNPTYLDSKK